MKVVIPFKQINPKSRLSGYLNKSEREELAICMLEDVLSALNFNKISEIYIIMADINGDNEKTRKILDANRGSMDIRLVCDNRELSKAINDFTLNPECAVIMSDLPLLTPKILKRFMEIDAELVVSPGRRGGTNMLLTRVPFKTNYHYGSFFKHLSLAKLMNLKVEVFDSFFSGLDVDTPEDLLEVMFHGLNTKTGQFLKNLGFRVCLTKNPVLVRTVRS